MPRPVSRIQRVACGEQRAVGDAQHRARRPCLSESNLLDRTRLFRAQAARESAAQEAAAAEASLAAKDEARAKAASDWIAEEKARLTPEEERKKKEAAATAAAAAEADAARKTARLEEDAAAAEAEAAAEAADKEKKERATLSQTMQGVGSREANVPQGLAQE